MGKDVEVRLGANSSEFEATLNRVDKNVDKMANSATANIARLGEAWRGVKDMAGDVVDVVAGIMQGLNELVAPAAAIERVEAQMRGLTGSAYEAKRVIAEVNKYALESQYTPTKLFENAMQLIRGGLDSGYAPELVRQLSVVAQGDQAKLDALVNSVLKGTQKGWGMEVLEGFNQAQVDMMGALRTSTGLNEAELKDAISKQKIAFEDIAGAIRELARDDGALAAANEELGNTLEGSQKRFENAWGNLQESFGAGLLEPMTELMDGLNEAMLSFGGDAEKLGAEAGEVLREIVGQVIEKLGEWQGNIGALKDDIKHLGLSIVGLLATIGAFKMQAWGAMMSVGDGAKAATKEIQVARGAFSGFVGAWNAGCASMKVAMGALIRSFKAMFVSSGIGILVVLLGEAAAMIYEMCSGADELSEKLKIDGDRSGEEYDELERRKNRWKEMRLPELEAERERIKEYTQNRQDRWQELQDSNSAEEVDWLQLESEMGAGKRMLLEIDALIVLRKRERKEKELQIAAEKEQQEEIKKAQEGKKRALEKLRNIYEQQAEASRQEIYEGYDLKVRRTMLENDVRRLNNQNYGESGLENTKLDVGGLEHRLGVLLQMAGREGMPHEELVGQAEEVKKIISELKKLEKAEREQRDNKEKLIKQQELAIAELEGNEEIIEKMKLDEAIKAREKELIAGGMDRDKAAVVAQGIEKNKLEIEKAKKEKEEIEAEKNRSPERIERMMQMGAELGNGGRVLNFGGGLLNETRKQTVVITELKQELRNWRDIWEGKKNVMAE